MMRLLNTSLSLGILRSNSGELFLISNGLVEVPGLSGVPGMLEPKSDTLVSITPKGRMFLAYMNAHGLMERKVG